MRARIDVSEIEAQTKIRAKYLRALENEEWSLLPGPTFIKSFLRTYAQALELDGKALVEEYRLHHEQPGEGVLEPIVSPRGGTSGRGGGRPPAGPSRAYIAAVGAIAAIIVLLIVLLISGGGGSSSPKAHTTSTAAGTPKHTRHTHTSATHPAALPAVVTLSLRPSAAVYVCLIGDNGRKLIPGLELQPGETTPTYHARRFEIRLGNSSLTMFVDGRARTVTPSSEPIGYSITKASGRHLLSSSQLPSCA
ncbi:MAG: cytoskeleton protein RodZ [Solirubrobacteraceae bacterium]|nr:cytoskeleton protein RodZ [Solirubrobacteraceae bacterium]